MVNMDSLWKKIPCTKNDLQLLGTLNGGQSFRWRKRNNLDNENEEWVGIFYDHVWCLSQDENNILYKVLGTLNTLIENDFKPPSKRLKSNKIQADKIVQNKQVGMTENNEYNHESLLKKYFQLDIDIKKHYSHWSDVDPYFKKAAEKFYGIRILAQDPVENLFSFICSQNNHISRISKMVEKLCILYGTEICKVDSEAIHSFPTVESLAKPDVESELRKAGFGYRARYINQSAKQIIEFGGLSWFDKLKNMNYKDAKAELCKLTGIGAKVADCICLMSLGHLHSIPVDTHIFQIATSLYLPHLSKNKTVTEKVYNEIGEYFRNLYGPMAGWAHTIMFCADLKMFQDSTSIKLVKNSTKIKNKRKKA